MLHLTSKGMDHHKPQSLPPPQSQLSNIFSLVLPDFQKKLSENDGNAYSAQTVNIFDYVKEQKVFRRSFYMW